MPVQAKKQGDGENTVSAAKLAEHLRFVRQHSPFYASSWSGADVPEEVEAPDLLSRVPLVDHSAYWRANTSRGSRVLTGPHEDGIIFKTGGTTSSPKVTFYSHAELLNVSFQFAECLVQCGVVRGDRVANLFYAGDLYGSFLLHILSVFHMGQLPGLQGAIQVPIAGHVSIPSMAGYMTELETTVVLGTVTTMCKIAEHLTATDPETGEQTHAAEAAAIASNVRVLLFAGEPLFDDQVAVLRKAFPRAEVRSIVYGSMECGAIGLPPAGLPGSNSLWSSEKMDPRLHVANRKYNVILEIMTEDGRVTTTPGEVGSLVVTNLNRRLMPVVRYPSGDLGCWVDFESGLFRLLGRDRLALRIGPVSLDFLHLRQIVTSALGPDRAIAGLQARVSRVDSKDLLTVLVAYRPATAAEEVGLRNVVAAALDEARPMFQGHVRDGLISPLHVEFVSTDALAVSERTGKVVDVLDTRPTAV
ncbi:hypothetical protein RB597_007458 [Gaeumannomyces tritici]